MTESNDSTNSSSTTQNDKNSVFVSKILATQYLIRHPFWKSFSLPMIIGQISYNLHKSYTESNYILFVYVLIAMHFLSGIFVSDKKFRHALGFFPHIIGIGCTSYFFYTDLFQKLTPWLKIRIITHAFGTIASFCFIASLHTKSVSLRSVLRRLSSYFGVFYFILNSYVLWWSNSETELFNNVLWTIIIRINAIICFLVSGGFCLDLFLKESCLIALYIVFSNIIFDVFLINSSFRSKTNLWLFIDYVIDDVAILCGYFYLYQFNSYQKMKLKTK